MKDIVGYLEKMEKSMIDKLFFVDKIDISKYDLLLDFGCADGTFIKNLSKLYPSLNYIGYDISAEMIKRANENSANNISFISNTKELKQALKGKKYAIVFSSVLHELNEQGLITALNLMSDAMAVIIRDMFFDKTKNKKIDCSSFLIQNKYVEEFENKYGKIDNLLNLYHYFLKYTYTKNWEHELLENYLGIDYERILSTLKEKEFSIVYDEQYTLPFKKQEVKNNFNYCLNLPTHRKLILIKKQYSSNI